jgi:formate--tetrahydrofolate ligase
MLDISSVADLAGLDPRHVETHGASRAVVSLDALGAPRRARQVLVTAVSPTPSGEGKTVTTLGLTQALRHRGLRSVAAIRTSSIGPTFGRKGGGAGGGKARVEPFDEALLAGLPELAAVEYANNLLAAMTDDAVRRGRIPLRPEDVTWRRVVDINDRSLRRIVASAGGGSLGPEHDTGFDITAASEVMGVLALAHDLTDLRARLGRIVVGITEDGEAVTAEDVGAAGAMAALLRDAARPTLLQTGDGTPVLTHAGPFANVSAGVSSVIADRIALGHADVVVTEAGFGAELGAEKFLHLKTVASGEHPDVVVLVATAQAIRAHGGPENLQAHLANLAAFGIPVVVAVNRRPDDTLDELDVIASTAEEAGVPWAASTVFADGAEGGLALASTVEEAFDEPSAPARLYPVGTPIVEAVETLATRLYGAAYVDWSVEAKTAIDRFETAGYGDLPPCVAKTPASLSHDPSLLGAPRGFAFPVVDVRLAAGGGYLTVLAGPVLTMPGLPERPRALDVDLLEDGTITGLV